MLRSEFIKLIGLGFTMTTLASLKSVFDKMPLQTFKQPALFIGHGSPMNALESNEFTQKWKSVANSFQKPQAILCISAHWLTNGSFITAMQKPETIHDFGGFPDELFKVSYACSGKPDLANEIHTTITDVNIQLNYDWGLDHGTWSILKQMYPLADVPVLQLSIDYNKPASYHFELAKQLKFLRNKGVLIIGSGNIVHNLSRIDWNRLNEIGFAYDWATEVDNLVVDFVKNRNFKALHDLPNSSKAALLAIPSLDHYLPLIYATALVDSNDEVEIFNQKAIAGSLTMTSIKIGK